MISLIIREQKFKSLSLISPQSCELGFFQTKITIKIHQTSLNMLLKWNPYMLLVSISISIGIMQNCMEVCQGIKSRTSIWSNSFTSGYILKGNEIQHVKKTVACPCLWWHYSKYPGYRINLYANQWINRQRKCICT